MPGGVFQGLSILISYRLCVNVQFAFEYHLYLLSAFAPSPPSLSLVTVSIWGGNYLH